MIRFGNLLGRHGRLECPCSTLRTRRNLVATVSRSEAERPSCHIRLNVVRLFQKCSPWPIHRHSLSVICACWATMVMCRASTFGK